MSNEYDFAPSVEDGPGIVESTARGFIGAIPFTNPIQAAVRAGAGQLGIPFIGSEPKDKKETFKQQYNRLAREEAMINDQARENNPYAYYPGMIGGALLGGAPYKTALGRMAQLAGNAAGVSTNKPEDSWSDQGLSALQAAGIGAAVGGLGEVGRAGMNKIGELGFKNILKQPMNLTAKSPKILKRAEELTKTPGPFEPRILWKLMNSEMDPRMKKIVEAGMWHKTKGSMLQGLKEAATLGGAGVGGYFGGSVMDMIAPNDSFKYAHLGAFGGMGGRMLLGGAVRPLANVAAYGIGRAATANPSMVGFQNAVRSAGNARIQSNDTYPGVADDEYGFAPEVKQNEISGKISK